MSSSHAKSELYNNCKQNVLRVSSDRHKQRLPFFAKKTLIKHIQFCHRFVLDAYFWKISHEIFSFVIFFLSQLPSNDRSFELKHFDFQRRVFKCLVLSGRKVIHTSQESSLVATPVETRVSIKRNYERKKVIQSLPFTRALYTLYKISFRWSKSWQQEEIHSRESNERENREKFSHSKKEIAISRISSKTFIKRLLCALKKSEMN